MFSNKSAWFSSSVPQASQNFWKMEGGTTASWKTADYLFSEDATCPDTLKIFESRDYLWNKVVVFHCLFLSVCEKRQSVKSVCLGHYVLPPASVQAEVRKVIGRFIWECDDEQCGAKGSHGSRICQIKDEHSEEEVSRSDPKPSDRDPLESEASLCDNLWDYPVINMPTGYVSMDNLQRYSGELRDFPPSCFRCSHCNVLCCLSEGKSTLRKNK